MWILAFFIVAAIIIIYVLFRKKNQTAKTEAVKQTQTEPQKYKSKKLMTDCETYFYKIISEEFSDKYLISPQVNLSSIVDKVKDFPKQYQNELNRIIDFGIFDKQTLQPLLLIEINDKTHEQPDRIKRDKKVKEIVKNAGIKLITFYTKYDNKRDYVVDRIKKELK